MCKGTVKQQYQVLLVRRKEIKTKTMTHLLDTFKARLESHAHAHKRPEHFLIGKGKGFKF